MKNSDSIILDSSHTCITRIQLPKTRLKYTLNNNLIKIP